MSKTSAIAEANSAFYEAFTARDLQAMEGLWAERSPVICIHPGWRPIFDREEIMASWNAILGSRMAPPVRASEPVIFVNGGIGFAIGYEHILGSALAVTNAFVEEEGAWRMILHQASQMANADEAEMPKGGAVH